MKFSKEDNKAIKATYLENNQEQTEKTSKEAVYGLAEMYGCEYGDIVKELLVV